jgi:sulfur relay (sulfurtransferase) DsrC/TusE family protein
MKIFISEADRQSAKRIALKNIARLYNLQDWDSKSNDELFNEISLLTEESAITINKLLKEYFKAYDEWFAFYQQRKKIQKESGTEYNLSNKDQKELSELINRRKNLMSCNFPNSILKLLEKIF